MSADATAEASLSLNAVLNAVRDDFSACLSKLRQCKVHDGRFGLKELRRIATHAPAVLVAVIGVPAVADPGTNEIDCELQIVAYIITRDGARLLRGKAARIIAQTLLLKVRANRWGLTGVGAPERLRADNLYSGDIDRHGVAIWAVLWRQKIRDRAPPSQPGSSWHCRAGGLRQSACTRAQW